MDNFLADEQLVVVETEDDHYLGTAEVRGGYSIVRNGYVGRPVHLNLADVQRITPATEHLSINQTEPDCFASGARTNAPLDAPAGARGAGR